MGAADVIELNHPPRQADAERMLSAFERSAQFPFQFLGQDDESPVLAEVGNSAVSPDVVDLSEDDGILPYRLTAEEIERANGHLRRGEGADYFPATSQELDAWEMYRTTDDENHRNEAIRQYSVKFTTAEQAGSWATDENTVVAGFLKRGMQDKEPFRSKIEARQNRIIAFLTHLDQQRQMLADLNARIARLREQRAQIDDNLLKLREAKALLADSGLNSDQDKLTRLRVLESDLAQQGVSLGINRDENGLVTNQEDAYNMTVQSEQVQQVKGEAIDQQIQEAVEQKERIYEKNPHLRDTQGFVASKDTPAMTSARQAALEQEAAALRSMTIASARNPERGREETIQVASAAEAVNRTPETQPSEAQMYADFDSMFGDAFAEPAVQVATIDANDSVVSDLDSTLTVETPQTAHANEFSGTEQIVAPAPVGSSASLARATGSFAAAADGGDAVKSVITEKFAAVAPTPEAPADNLEVSVNAVPDDPQNQKPAALVA